MMDGSHGISEDQSMHHVFILDSGAPVHCTGDKYLLSDYRDEAMPYRYLRGASGKQMNVHGTGSIHNDKFQVKDVLYVPDLNCKTIFSVGQLHEHHLIFFFDHDGTCSVIDIKRSWNLNHKIVGKARQAHGLFILDYLRVPRLPPNRDPVPMLETRESSRVVAAVVKERTADGAKGKGVVVNVNQLQVEITEAVIEAPRKTTAAVVQAIAEPPSRSTDYLISPAPNKRLKRTIMSWTKGEHLGSGSFGSVYEAISDAGFFFAVKEVSLVDQGFDANKRILNLEHEISVLSRLDHENIVKYLGTEKKGGKLYILLELVSQGSLSALYQKYRLQDSQVSAYTRQILNGLHYLHQQNVLHRDIKCANILVDASGLIKLADFGLAKEVSILNQANSCKGSVYWMAPEVAKAKPHGPPADVWSLGCTVLEMLTGKLPYPDMEWIHAFLTIGRGIPPEIPDTLSEDARDFIKKCVQVNPNDRPSAAELLKHPFVQRPLQ